MGRRPCCEKEGLNRGVWTAMEDKLLKDYIQLHGEGQWRSLPIKAGLKRCGKSCRLRWLNYLNPSIKRGNITPDEEDLIIRLHKLLGNRWALIAGRLPGRTDNEIKNYWNTNLSKRVERDNNPKRQSKCYTKKITKPAEKVQSKSSPNTVIRTKAVKCTKAVLAPPPPPPPPPITTEPPLVPPPLMDLATMDDFNMSFSEFFDSQKLTSSMSSDVCSPMGFVDDIFSEEMMEDWKANDFTLDASMLESLLQV